MKMTMRILVCFAISLRLWPSLYHVSAHTEAPIPEVAAEFALIYNCDEDRIIYAKDATERMYPASLTKLMSVLVALEKETDYERSVVIRSEALEGLEAANASVAGLIAGEELRFLDLLYAALLPSGADATNMIAYEIGGSEDAFVAMMNEKAQELGMMDTYFVNASGLHEKDHFSSALDLMRLLQAAMKQELFYEIFTTDRYTTLNERHTFISSAHLMAQKAGIDDQFLQGVKTGFTLEAGLCIAFFTRVNDADYLVVLGNSGNDLYSYQNIIDANHIYQFLKKHYAYHTLFDSEEVISDAQVQYGTQEQVQLISHEEIRILSYHDALTTQVELRYDPLIAPLHSEEVLGDLIVWDEEQQLEYRFPLYAMRSIERNWFAYLMQGWWVFGLALIGVGFMIYRMRLSLPKWVPLKHSSMRQNESHTQTHAILTPSDTSPFHQHQRRSVSLLSHDTLKTRRKDKRKRYGSLVIQRKKAQKKLKKKPSELTYQIRRKRKQKG